MRSCLNECFFLYPTCPVAYFFVCANDIPLDLDRHDRSTLTPVDVDAVSQHAHA